MKVKRLDRNGHSCLVDNRGTAQWVVDSVVDVSAPFGAAVVRDYMEKGYLVVDEQRGRLLQSVKELKAKSDIVLMPPLEGG